MPLKHVDCFSGVGGICTGFKAAGIETVLGVEYVGCCVETYINNHPNVNVLHKDIRSVTENDISNAIFDNGVDILTAGMPCETFSTAGNTSRSFYDNRQTLYKEAIRIAKILGAKLILFENVPGILSKKIAKHSTELIINKIYDDLTASGYPYIINTILNASDFGVPQDRNRLFILASSKNIKLTLPVAKHSNRITVSESLVDIPKDIFNTVPTNGTVSYLNKDSAYSLLMKNNDFWMLNSHNKLTYHVKPNHRPGTIKRFSLIEQGEGLKDLFIKYSPEKVRELQAEKVLPKKWYIQRNRRLVSDKPSVTVTSHCLDELVHPTENRGLTVREVARLQSFPDAYDFQGGPFICPHIDARQDKYEQIGDAVPPLLAYYWGLTLKSILKEN
jgi:DNA (cytosine-5)-methyltransferase 1